MFNAMYMLIVNDSLLSELDVAKFIKHESSILFKLFYSLLKH